MIEALRLTDDSALPRALWLLSAEVEIELHSLSSILLQPGMAVWWSSEPLLRCDRADSSLLVILVRIETFSHESAAIETAHRLLIMSALQERCGCSVQRLRLSFTFSLSSILLQPGMAVRWSSEPLLRCDRADSSLLVILVRMETFSQESAAIETAHRLLIMSALQERCGCSVQRADSSLLVILVRMETFSQESAAVETAHRLPYHVCTSRALWLLCAES